MFSVPVEAAACSCVSRETLLAPIPRGDWNRVDLILWALENLDADQVALTDGKCEHVGRPMGNPPRGRRPFGEMPTAVSLLQHVWIPECWRFPLAASGALNGCGCFTWNRAQWLACIDRAP